MSKKATKKASKKIFARKATKKVARKKPIRKIKPPVRLSNRD